MLLSLLLLALALVMLLFSVVGVGADVCVLVRLCCYFLSRWCSRDMLKVACLVLRKMRRLLE